MTPRPPKRRGALGSAIALFLAAAISAGLLAGFFGSRAPFLDSLAHLRAHAAVALILLGLVLFARRLPAAGLASVLTAGFALAGLSPYLLPRSTGAQAAGSLPRYTLLQMNLRYDAPDKTAALAAIGSAAPDVVTVQEATNDWKPALASLAGRYPYQFSCAPANGDGDAAILSRRPFAEGDEGVCVPGARLAAKRIDFNGTAVTIASEHLHWPWPGEQWTDLQRLAPTLSALPAPLLVAGDFNAAPWSAAVARYAALSRTAIAPGVGATWITRLLPASAARFAGLAIDNVLSSDAVRIVAVRTLDPTGSDHLPVLVTFTLPYAPAAAPKVQTVAR